jgi:hypothetical protein
VKRHGIEIGAAMVYKAAGGLKGFRNPGIPSWNKRITNETRWSGISGI